MKAECPESVFSAAMLSLLVHAVLSLAVLTCGDAPTLQWVSTEHIGRLTGAPPNPLAPIGSVRGFELLP